MAAQHALRSSALDADIPEADSAVFTTGKELRLASGEKSKIRGSSSAVGAAD
eukprot:CAMPEP_0115166792 /NCGR_PEP_ID=MMETSP0227-20121206/74308_1 /TAXON_ID=89957 /ORGANISM="Polarella glacialis, Strain CCMP 1383" /LENGTH=51 /DNA_ID=CAMNT_0002579341 /DNA_START=444 /DNA_END=597 /DNA_ORIENTATION=+